MKLFMVEFKIIDHFADDAGMHASAERTLVEANSKMEATKKFCLDMADCSYSILDVREQFV